MLMARRLCESAGKSSWLGELETLVSVAAYDAFGGEVEARTPPQYAPAFVHSLCERRLTTYQPRRLGNSRGIERSRCRGS